tara:strand:+ start:32254 stop:32619 length:366 start_codon:yes stop_codon:yes gene_type:complete
MRLLASILIAACLLLSGCSDPVKDLGHSYRYSISEAFIVVEVYHDEETIGQEYALAVYNITSIKDYETYQETPFVVVKTADGESFYLYDITMREFLALSGEAMGPWMLDFPASSVPQRSSP